MTLPKMDSRIGLDYIVENVEYVRKLGAALDTQNMTVKKQVFELLSALCAYSGDGYRRAIETLEQYKNLKCERYRFQLVVNELDRTRAVEYQGALLAFINCVIISADSLQSRIRVRNEFIGLNLLSVLNNLRRTASGVPDIGVQLDVFDEQRECDEAQSLQGPEGINLNSHLDVFYAILRQVTATPQEIPFLSILQHLLRLDPKEAISDIVWDTAETLVHRATLLENREDSTRLLRAPSVQKFTCPNCAGLSSSLAVAATRKPSTSNPLVVAAAAAAAAAAVTCSSPGGGGSGTVQTAPAPPPPPPPFLHNASLPPPPPPPMAHGHGVAPPPPAPPAPGHHTAHLTSTAGGVLSAAHDPTAYGALMSRQATGTDPAGGGDPQRLLPQQETPVPKTKMKTINWNKIPPQKVVGRVNIWSIVADSHQNSPKADLDWAEMEGLFCQQTQTASVHGSPKMGRSDAMAGGGGAANAGGAGGGDTLERRAKKDNCEITLLDGKRSLNVNIFLKQFRTTNEDIIFLIKNGDHDDIGAEKLRGLLKILPEIDELDMLKSFDGDKNRLGNAEKFLLHLLDVPNYKLRIESMLLKEEFAANLGYLEPSINAMLFAGEDLMTNKALQEVLYMVVVAGNFLNSGGYAGNAAGVKLSSLQKLTDIRANKPGMNLIHFVALQAEKRNKALLVFPDQMSTLENASKTTVEQLNNEINALDTRMKKIKRQIDLPATECDIKAQMDDFLRGAEREVAMLQRGMKELDNLRVQMADFFCEDPSTFKMEECLKVFHIFCEKFKQAVAENERRRLQEEQAILRRKQREEQLAYKRRQLSQAGTPVSDCENGFPLDGFQSDVRFSPAMARRRIGSFNSGAGDAAGLRDDAMSPDVTPNGSLRRRRSRVLSEEDEGNLMDFLRSSGHDNGSRERKPSSYGSLDRSWARRARSGSASKKRPDLLNVDFSADRERPSSPSPLAESKPLPAEETKQPRISREWRQKIESWLQANEQDEKQNEDYRRRARRVANNRRSIETDTESERGKLDPLPEEKIPATSAQSSPEPRTYKRVYPDWKPSATLDKTDVVGTIEAIEDAQPRSKDKSALRKSNLNVSNTSEDVELDTRQQLRRQRSRETMLSDGYSSGAGGGSVQLQSIIEEDKRKTVIQKLGERPATDRLHIYLRGDRDVDLWDKSGSVMPLSKPNTEAPPPPSGDSPPVAVTKTPASDLTTADNPTHVPRRIRRPLSGDSVDLPTSRRGAEIDADNIETPPVTRRTFSVEKVPQPPPCRKLHASQRTRSDHDDAERSQRDADTKTTTTKDAPPPPASTETLGDGQFDRFSAARRTRRYKRPTDYSSAEEKCSGSPDSPTETGAGVTATAKGTGEPVDCAEKEIRLRRWQDKLTAKDRDCSPPAATIASATTATANTTSSRLEKIGRNLSAINQEDVREAIRNLKSPTDTPERVWSPPREILKVVPMKSCIYEMNDEGFEETQSLVSDTPSHGKDSTTSSCNENVDATNLSTSGGGGGNSNGSTAKSPAATVTDAAKIAKHRVKPSPSRLSSSVGTSRQRTTASSNVAGSRRPVTTGGAVNATVLAGPIHSLLERSRSMRHGIMPSATSSSLHSTPRRTNSLRKIVSQPSIPASRRAETERSSSRTSLRSSRSSLNSTMSTNTVRKVPLKAASAEASPTKRPTLPAAPATNTTVNRGASAAAAPRIPASRSSSSGSSVGGPTSLRKSGSGGGHQSTSATPLPPSASSSNFSFKEHATGAGRLAHAHGRPATSTRPATSRSSSTATVSSTGTAAAPAPRTSSFMRPTTSSATKVASFRQK